MPCRCLSVEEGESFVVNDIVVHNSGGKESALNTVRNLAGFHAVIDPAVAGKEVRAQPLAIQVEQGTHNPSFDVLQHPCQKQILNEP